MNLSKQSNLVVFVVLCAVIGVMASISRGNSATQDPGSLDRRLSMLEQRFYSVESSISRLQQYVATRPSIPHPSTSPNDRELLLMREELQRLTLRVTEIECGLIKLDEQTTPAARRNPTPKSNDPFPLNPDQAVRLSTHP